MSIRRDDVFKIVFGSDINKEYLKSFLEAILKRKIKKIKVKNEVSLKKIHIKSSYSFVLNDNIMIKKIFFIIDKINI